MFQFAANFKLVKKFIVERAKKKNKEAQKESSEVESEMACLFNSKSSSIFSNKELHSLRKLEQRKKVFLDSAETKWTMKSRATWLAEGDNNTKFFHNYSYYPPFLWITKEMMSQGP
jgi:hypothetical protein